MIDLQNLSKTFSTPHAEVEALRNVSLRIERHEIFGILGKSGAGKTTLLRSVNLLERPTQGHVYVNGEDLTTCDAAELRQRRRRIGMIFQHFNLLNSRTTFENVALPLELAGLPTHLIQEKVNQLLKLVEISDRQHHFPAELSGGQKQRVAIARALATEPDILLCDEATSALDAHSTKSILHLLKKINRELGLTILLITHELEVIKEICDRSAVMHEGEIVELKSTLELFTKPQHEVTKSLIQKAFHLTPAFLPPSDQDAALLVQLTFIGEQSEAPIIANLIKNFDIMINIQQADMEKIQEKSIGYMVCHITGTKLSVDQALAHLKASTIQMEILHHV